MTYACYEGLLVVPLLPQCLLHSSGAARIPAAKRCVYKRVAVTVQGCSQLKTAYAIAVQLKTA